MVSYPSIDEINNINDVSVYGLDTLSSFHEAFLIVDRNSFIQKIIDSGEKYPPMFLDVSHYENGTYVIEIMKKIETNTYFY
jgi:hypothetical protein